MKTLKHLFRYYIPYLGTMITYLIIGLIIISLAMVLPQITKYIIASVIGNESFSLFGITIANETLEEKEMLFLYLSVSWIAIVVLRQGLAYFRSYIMTKSSIKAVCKMREDVFRKMIWQSQSFLHKENTGNVLTVIHGDNEVIKNFFTGTVPTIIESLFGFVFASIMIGKMNFWLVLTAYVFTIPLFILARKFGKVYFKWYHFVREAQADLSMVAQENLNGIRIVKAYAQEEQEKAKFDKCNQNFRYHGINYMVIWGKYFIPFAIVYDLPRILVTVIAALLVVNGYNGSVSAITLAEFVAVTSYLNYILVPFENANNWLNSAQQAATSADKVFRFLNEGSSITSPAKPQKVDLKNTHIKFENVSLSIDRKIILRDINLDLPQGKRIGIMGTTGSGKSMITNVMSRFYDPTSGRVTLNDVDIKELDLTDLRSVFAPVLQDVFLFSDTIAKNIAFGVPDATFGDVKRCAEIAQADDFISETPDEYNTIVGERGMGLSGGQKQRISIARALLYNAPVLIFDDATSALDMETEEKLYDALKAQGLNRSQIIIAHRISSVKDCDEILMLENGKIVERGTHDELVALNGKYCAIYKEQYSTVLEANLKG